jgi:hypothetical protein
MIKHVLWGMVALVAIIGVVEAQQAPTISLEQFQETIAYLTVTAAKLRYERDQLLKQDAEQKATIIELTKKLAPPEKPADKKD